MAQVTSATFRFMRRIQVREYEPAEAETSLTINLAEGEDPAEALKFVEGLASEFTHDALGMPINTRLPARASGTVKHTTSVKGAIVTEPASRTQPTKETAPQTPPPAQSDIPGEPSAPAHPAQPAQQAPASDIPDAPPPAQPAPAAQVANGAVVKDLSKKVGDLVRQAKITNEEVKALYPKYQIKRIADLKPEQADAFQTDIDGIVKRNESAADL